MRARASEALLALAAAGAVVALVVTAVVSTRAGVAVLCAAAAVGLLGLAYLARMVVGRLERIDHLADVAHQTRRIALRNRRVTVKIERRTRVLARRSEVAERRQVRTDKRVKRTVEQVRELRARTTQDAVRTHAVLDTVASDAVRLARLVDRLAPGSSGLPGLGGWAVTPSTLLDMADEIERLLGPVTVMECGSGSSTLFFALLLAHRGVGGHVVALENDARFAEETRTHLRRHGVDHLATVVDAPITSCELPGGVARPWFDTSGLPDVGPVDLLFVDGPPRSTAAQARYPAVPLLGHLLAPQAWVVLDDTHRPDEQGILERWQAEEQHRPLVVERSNGRSTMLRAT